MYFGLQAVKLSREAQSDPKDRAAEMRCVVEIWTNKQKENINTGILDTQNVSTRRFLI